MQISARLNTEPTGNENSRMGSAALLQLVFLSQSNPDDFSVTKKREKKWSVCVCVCVCVHVRTCASLHVCVYS